MNRYFNAKKKGFDPIQTAMLQAEVKKQVEAMQSECLNKGFMFSLSVVLDTLQAEEYLGERSKELMPKLVKDILYSWELLDRDLLTMQDVSDSIYSLSGMRIHPEYFDNANKGADDMVEVDHA